MKINTLTTSEEQLMMIIWRLESAYMKEIMAAYQEPKPHQNTVSTFLKILVEKDYLDIERKGRIFKYIPSIKLETYRKHLLTNFLSNFYDNDKNLLLKELGIDIQPKTKEIVTTKAEKVEKAEKSPTSKFIEEILTPNKSKKKKDKEKKEDKEKDKKKKKKDKK